MTQIIRREDFEALAKITTKNGFREIFKNMILSREDPRLKLLHFKTGDVMKITPTNVRMIEKEGEQLNTLIIIFIKTYVFQTLLVSASEQFSPEQSISTIL